MLPLCRRGPLLEVFRAVVSDDNLDERLGEPLCEGAQIRWVIWIHSYAMGELFKGSDVLADFAFLYLKFLHVILGLFMFGIVGEHILEFALHLLPGGAPKEEARVGMDCIEPFIHLLGPFFDLRSFDQGEEVATLLDGVASDGGVIIHEHESMKLSKEMHRAFPTAIKVVWGISFEVKVIDSGDV